jgi:hypothetical protein
VRYARSMKLRPPASHFRVGEPRSGRGRRIHSNSAFTDSRILVGEVGRLTPSLSGPGKVFCPRRAVAQRPVFRGCALSDASGDPLGLPLLITYQVPFAGQRHAGTASSASWCRHGRCGRGSMGPTASSCLGNAERSLTISVAKRSRAATRRSRLVLIQPLAARPPVVGQAGELRRVVARPAHRDRDQGGTASGCAG